MFCAKPLLRLTNGLIFGGFFVFVLCAFNSNHMMEADAPVDSQCRTQEEQEREQCHQYQQHP